MNELHVALLDLRRALAVEILRHPWRFALLVLSYIPIRLAVEWWRPGG